MKNLFVLIFIPFLFSCISVDFENAVKDSAVNLQKPFVSDFPSDSPAPNIEAVERIIERPVYVPASEAPPARTPAGDRSVRASNNDGIIKPQDYSHAAMIYDFDPDFVYEVYAQPLRVCDITLQAGERAVEPPFVSDSERWIIGAGISYENGTAVQHIYIKPASSGISASLIINTDRRVYRIILKSFSDVHMPVVRWKYPSSLPSNYIVPLDTGIENSFAGINPRYLSFNYRVTYSIFNKPYWLPELAFDDGSKTYIRFPNLILQRELPTVFENRNDVLNYRVDGNLIIIDKLIENLSLRVGKTEVTVMKKRR